MVNAPAAIAQDDKDTYETRQFNLQAQDRVYDEAKQVFVQWKITFQRSTELLKDLLAAFKDKEEEKNRSQGSKTKRSFPRKKQKCLHNQCKSSQTRDA